jgi:peptide/nickel transport system substrate-binding protein
LERKAAAGGNWWDKLGKPQYGGEMVFRLNRKIVNFDPYYGVHLTQIYTAWMERLHAVDWTLDPSVSIDSKGLRPTHGKGYLAETWEFTDPYTYVVHLRKGVRWQDVPPANGREFTADDVVFHFQRMYGLGSGMKPSPAQSNVAIAKELISVTATDKYTVVFKWKTANRELIIDSMQEVGTSLCIENPEAVKKWGDLQDWHHAVGTGPFILKEFIPDISATLVKNPDYWGNDERYPQNKLPYIDKLKLMIIPDQATTLAEMIAGRIDAADQISPNLAQSLQKTNPEILQIYDPANTAVTLDPRNDRPPFNDIRVRKAMQLAIDLPGIARNYYKGNVEPYPSSLTSRALKGWGFPYEEWPQDLKDEYAYNPGLAKKLLADAGYANGFKTNIIADTTGDLDLLEVVKSYFTDIGIDMEIRPMDSTEWIAFVLNGRKHDQLAQRTIAPYGHRHDPIRQLGRLRTGALSNYLMINDPVLDNFQPKAIAAAGEGEVKQILRDGNEYIARQHFAISLLSPGSYTVYQPWLKGFHGQFGAVCSAAGSPQLLSFYPARFWIDHELKKKMGHE